MKRSAAHPTQCAFKPVREGERVDAVGPPQEQGSSNDEDTCDSWASNSYPPKRNSV